MANLRIRMVLSTTAMCFVSIVAVTPVLGIPTQERFRLVRVAQPAKMSDRAPTIDEIREQIRNGTLPESILEDYRTVFPGLTDEQIEERYASALPRATTNERYAESSSTFAGTWFDFRANVWNIYSTNLDEAKKIAAETQHDGMETSAFEVTYSLLHLQNSLEQVEEVVRDEAHFALSIEPRLNAVLLKLPSSSQDTAKRAQAISATVVQFDDSLPTDEVPAFCTTHYNCGIPLRGGVNLGRYQNGSSLTGCTIGFTASATDGSRWVYTAGHCILQSEINSGTIYGHGTQAIGPPRSTYQNGTVDAGRIRIDSSYWLSGGRGYIYDTPTATFTIDYAITSASTIEQGDTVCYSGRNDQPGDDKCGVITAVNINGKPQVTGVKICGGDSGGPAFALIGPDIFAYGLLSVANLQPSTDCTPSPSSAGQGSFSAIPHINAYMDSITAADIRVDVH